MGGMQPLPHAGEPVVEAGGEVVVGLVVVFVTLPQQVGVQVSVGEPGG